MAETSYPWDGTSTGDASTAPYDAATEFAAMVAAIAGSLALSNRGAVVRDALNELSCTPGSGKVTIGTGYAIAYGTLYSNDTAKDLTIDPASVSTRVDRVVLRKSWSAQTVRLTVIKGVEGAGAPALGAGTPAYTQTAGTTWDVPLYRVSITTGGTISISASGGADDRVYTPVHGDQSAEGGTSHAYAQITGAPPVGSTPTNVNPAVASAIGSGSTYAAGNHTHGMIPPQVAYKTALEAKASNVLANDSVLFVPVNTGFVYKIELVLVVQSPTATGFQFALTFPSGTYYDSGVYGPIAYPNTADSTQMVYYQGPASGYGFSTVDSVNHRIVASGIFVAIADGDIHVQWAAELAGTANVLAGSYIVATLVG